jgi:uncharacterized protein
LRKNLKVLDGLQELDLKIDSLNGDVKSLEEGVAALEAEVAEAETSIQARNEELAALEDEKRQLEENLAAEVENISRSEVRLKEIKTQKEYQAVSKEITTARKLKTELEEQVLQKITQIDEVRADVNGRQEKLQLLVQNIGERKAELVGQIDQLKSTMASENTAREDAVKALPASVVRRYTLLRQQRRGIAVVEAREGCCSGCHMNLPPQLYNSLYRGEDLITCPHCQRILVMRQEQQ